MAESFKPLAQQQVPDSGTVIYTVNAATQAIIKSISVVNPSLAAATIAIRVNGSADENLILPVVPVDAGGWAEYEGTIDLDTGGTISAESDTNDALTITVFGMEIS